MRHACCVLGDFDDLAWYTGAEEMPGEIDLVVKEQFQIVIDVSAVTAMHSCRPSVKERSRLCGCFWSTALRQKEPTSKMCSANSRFDLLFYEKALWSKWSTRAY